MATIFYAYPSKPFHIGETIRAAAEEINQGTEVKIVDWQDLENTGRLLIEPILERISDAEIFACDLSVENMNVLFELGYAIGRGKKIWISNNTGVEVKNNNRNGIGTLKTVGYSGYRNRHDLVRNLYKDQPWEGELSPIVPLLSSRSNTPASNSLFYVKSAVQTDASVALTDFLRSPDGFAEIIEDDPTEVPWQTLEWYVRNIQGTEAVLVHLLGNDQQVSVEHNLRCSLVAGIGLGLSRKVLLLAHEPFESPLDYQDLLRTHSTSSQCRQVAENWTKLVRRQLEDIHRERTLRRLSRQALSSLQELSVGEMVAENERQSINEYLVPTSTYYDALAGRQVLFVGRKGTGKTANLYAVARELEADRTNLVCVIKPAGYELDGVVRILRENLERSEKGFLVESMWKFLILTQLAITIQKQIKNRPSHYATTQSEVALLSFIEGNSSLFTDSFAERLDYAVRRLEQVAKERTPLEQRIKTSELLHAEILSRLRDLLRNALQAKSRVAILIDNLDKSWGRGGEIRLLSDFLFGLLGVAGRIEEEFQSESGSTPSVHLTLAVFLRSDIFSYLKDVARERDKLTYTSIAWTDEELLSRVVDERLTYFFNPERNVEDLWAHFFVDAIGPTPVREYLVRHALPRPRDVIFLTNAAIGQAVNRGHATVGKEDIEAAIAKYSQFAFDSIIAEDDPRYGHLENLLYEFVGSSQSVTELIIKSRMHKAKVPEGLHERYLEILLDLNFIGFVSIDGKVDYVSDEEERRRKLIIARRRASQMHKDGSGVRFIIHSAFHPVLGIAS